MQNTWHLTSWSGGALLCSMCRNIKPLFNFEPPATEQEIRAACLQFVRKLSGFTRPSQANEETFERAVDDIAKIARALVDSLETSAPPKNRDLEAEKARERSRQRFGVPVTGTSEE